MEKSEFKKEVGFMIILARNATLVLESFGSSVLHLSLLTIESLVKGKK